ncbi:MAG: adenosylmethionine--8-amino-7-oxononanoate transaminase [Pirellulaceae bacterium]
MIEKSLTPPPRETRAESLIQRDRRHVWHPFSYPSSTSDPIVIESANGAMLHTVDGRELLDCISSWWVNLFGHAHPRIAAAISEQAQRLEQVIFAGFTHEPAVQLADSLATLLPGDLNRVFFSDDGSTSVEVAWKIAIQYWQNLGQTTRRRLMAFDGGYHGDTLGAMSVGASSGFFEPWRRWMIDVDVIPFADTWHGDVEIETREAAALATLDQFLEQHGDEVAAMIMEPLVQGAAGMRMCRPQFVVDVIERLRQHDVLVIFDEVMTGFGRTGENFACDVADVQPDLICLSKGVTGGFLPLGVTVASDRIYESFTGDQPVMFCHGHSYTANPLGCAAANASLELLQLPETRRAWDAIAAAHQDGLQQVSRHPCATRLRQRGTIAAMDISVDDPGYSSTVGDQLKQWFWEPHESIPDVLIRPLGNVIYLMPPYCMTEQQLKTAWIAIDRALELVTDIQ